MPEPVRSRTMHGPTARTALRRAGGTDGRAVAVAQSGAIDRVSRKLGIKGALRCRRCWQVWLVIVLSWGVGEAGVALRGRG